MSFLSTTSDVCGILGFALSLITLYNTYAVRKSIETINKINDYKSARSEILKTIEERIKEISNYTELPQFNTEIPDIIDLIKRISDFKIWNPAQKNILNDAQIFSLVKTMILNAC